MNRIQATDLFMRAPLGAGVNGFCTCEPSKYFMRMMMVAALNLNQQMFAPAIFGKVLQSILNNALTTSEAPPYNGRHSYERLTHVSLVARNLMNHFFECPSITSTLMRELMNNMGNVYDQEDWYVKFNDRIAESNVECQVCMSEATYGLLFIKFTGHATSLANEITGMSYNLIGAKAVPLPPTRSGHKQQRLRASPFFDDDDDDADDEEEEANE